MRNNYVEIFSKIKSEIEEHSLLELVEFQVYPSISKDIIIAVEQKIGQPLADPILNFYGQTNGLKLTWRWNSRLSLEEFERAKEKYDDYPAELDGNEDIPYACINLISLEDCFLNLAWDGLELGDTQATTEFGGVAHPHDNFAKMVKPFDLFSTFYSMAFVLEEGVVDPKVILLSDYYVQWNYSRITNFESYLEFLLVSRGIVESRKRLYSEYRGDLKPVLQTPSGYWKTEDIPKLFRNL